MNSDLELSAIQLKRGHLRRVDNGRGALLQCLTGTLWLTQEDDPRDIVLEAGEETIIDRDGTSIVSALSDTSFVLSREPAALSVLWHTRATPAAH